MAIAVSFSPCTPGVVTDSTDMSMPAKVHGRQPQLTEVLETALHVGKNRVVARGFGHQAPLFELRRGEMLLQRDLARDRRRPERPGRQSGQSGGSASFITWRRRIPQAVWNCARAFMRLPPPAVLSERTQIQATREGRQGRPWHTPAGNAYRYIVRSVT